MNKFFNAKRHTPQHTQKFWCNACDRNTVDSDKPETGNFYVIFGHAWDPVSKDFDGDYGGFMFALCPTCEAE